MQDKIKTFLYPNRSLILISKSNNTNIFYGALTGKLPLQVELAQKLSFEGYKYRTFSQPGEKLAVH